MSKITDHIGMYSTKISTGYYLPAVFSERDPELREELQKLLGQRRPSGYMSEESGWNVPAELIPDWAK